MPKTKKEKPPKKRRHKCSGCNRVKDDVTFDADPYASDVNADYTPRWMCEECRHESAMDI